MCARRKDLQLQVWADMESTPANMIVNTDKSKYEWEKLWRSWKS